MTIDTAEKISFASEIRPLFRDFDINSMIKARGLDLSNFEQVSAKADIILHRLEVGTMPCDRPWPEKDVRTFRRWIAEGKRP